MAVRRVDDEHVDVRDEQRLRALQPFRADADCCGDPEASSLVLRRMRELHALLDVLHRDEASQHAVGVDDRQLLDLVPVERLPCLLEVRADRDRDEALRGHEGRDRPVDVVLEAKIAIGQDPDELAALVRDRDAGDVVVGHELQGLGDECVGPQRHGLDDHAGLRALHLVDLGHLLGHRKIPVHHTDAALTGQRDRHPRLRDRVHRG